MGKVKISLTVDESDVKRLIDSIERLAYAVERESNRLNGETPEEGNLDEDDTQAS